MASSDERERRATLARLLADFTTTPAALNAVLPLLNTATHVQLRHLCTRASIPGYGKFTKVEGLRSFVASWIRTKLEAMTSTAPPPPQTQEPPSIQEVDVDATQDSQQDPSSFSVFQDPSQVAPPPPFKPTPMSPTAAFNKSPSSSNDLNALAAFLKSRQTETANLLSMVCSLIKVVTPLLEGNDQLQEMVKVLQFSMDYIRSGEESQSNLLTHMLNKLQAHQSSNQGNAAPSFSPLYNVSMFAGVGKTRHHSSASEFKAHAANFPPLSQPKVVDFKAKTKKKSYKAAFQAKVSVSRSNAVARERCFRLTPTSNKVTPSTLSTQLLGRCVEKWLKEQMPDLQGRILEFVRYDPRGGIYIQCGVTFLAPLQKFFEELGSSVFTLDSIGEWIHSELPPSICAGKTAFVIDNIPLNTDMEDVLPELILSNPSWGLKEVDIGTKICKPRRLQRRAAPTGNRWIDCQSVEFWADAQLTAQLKQACTAQWGYGIATLRVFHRPIVKCYNCNKEGHMADACRSLPRCRWCQGSHASAACPSRQPQTSPPTQMAFSAPPSASQPRRRQNLPKRRQLRAPDAEGWIEVQHGCRHENSDHAQDTDNDEVMLCTREAEEAPGINK